MSGGDKFAFFTGQRRIVYDKVHGNGRLGNFLERNRFRIVRGTEGIADVDIGNAGDGYYRADTGLLYFDLFQTLKFIELADLYLAALFRLMGIDHDNLLIGTDSTVVYLADTDTADIFVVVNCADEYLCAGFRIAFRCRDIVENGLKQRLHILWRVGQL